MLSGQGHYPEEVTLYAHVLTCWGVTPGRDALQNAGPQFFLPVLDNFQKPTLSPFQHAWSHGLPGGPRAEWGETATALVQLVSPRALQGPGLRGQPWGGHSSPSALPASLLPRRQRLPFTTDPALIILGGGAATHRAQSLLPRSRSRPFARTRNPLKLPHRKGQQGAGHICVRPPPAPDPALLSHSRGG